MSCLSFLSVQTGELRLSHKGPQANRGARKSRPRSCVLGASGHHRRAGHTPGPPEASLNRTTQNPHAARLHHGQATRPLGGSESYGAATSSSKGLVSREERERERERESERERARARAPHTHTHTQRHTHRHIHRHTKTHTRRHTQRHTHTDTHRCRHTHRHTQRHTDTDTHIDTDTHRYTQTHTQRHTQTQTHTDIHRHTQIYTDTHTETHRHTHRHTKTHTHTDTHTQRHAETQSLKLSIITHTHEACSSQSPGPGQPPLAHRDPWGWCLLLSGPGPSPASEGGCRGAIPCPS